MAESAAYLAETNDPTLDQRVSIAFLVVDTIFLLVFYLSRYLNPEAVRVPMVVCNTLCYVLCLGSAATGILMVKIGGAGYHATAIPVSTYQTWLKLSKTLEFTYTLAVMFSKLAAVFLYYQVFEVPNYRRVIIGIGVIIVLQGVIAFILAFSICRPFRYFWTQAVDVHDGTCGDVMLFYKSFSIPSLVTDVAMVVLPFPLLLKLQMPTLEKIGIILTFLAASLGIITCILRFSVFFTVPLFSDPTWYASGGPMIYALVEPSIYMIANILPTTRHLFRRVHRKARRAVQLRYGSRNTGDTHSHSTELEQRIENNSRLSGRGAASRQGNGAATSSQEQLVLGKWFYDHHQHDSDRARSADTASLTMPEPGPPGH